MTPHMAKALLLLISALPPAAQNPETPVRAELVAETTTLREGDNWVGLQLQMQAGWHVYWRNPGTSGQATSLRWKLPDSAQASDMQWPQPEIQDNGKSVSYIYSDTVLLPAIIHIDDVQTPAPVTLRAEAHWLACKDICIPGHASLSLPMTVSDAPAQWSGAHARFEAMRARLPQPMPSDLHARALVRGGRLSIDVTSIASLGHVDQLHWLPASRRIVDENDQPQLRMDRDRLHIELPLRPELPASLDHVDGLLIVDDGDRSRAIALSAPLVTALPSGDADTVDIAGMLQAGAALLLFTFVIGVILRSWYSGFVPTHRSALAVARTRTPRSLPRLR